MPLSAAAPNRRPSKFGVRRPRLLLGLASVLLLLAALPLVALAQVNPPPHLFAGTVNVDGDRAADGVAVAAMIGGEEVAATAVKDGRYVLKVPGAAGQTVAFTVGGTATGQTAVWRQGNTDILNLEADSTQPAATPTPSLTPAPSPTPVICAVQPPPPHVFIGTARLNGQPAARGTMITALVDGQEAAAAAAAAGGSYQLRVQQCHTPLAGKTISFTVGGTATGQTAVWSQGRIVALDLTASSDRPAPTPIPEVEPTPAPRPTATPYPTPTPAPPRPAAGSVAEAFEEPLASGSVLAVWQGDDDETGEPAPLLDTPEEFSQGNLLNRGDIIWIKLTRTLEWEGQRLVTGWNLVRIP